MDALKELQEKIEAAEGENERFYIHLHSRAGLMWQHLLTLERMGNIGPKSPVVKEFGVLLSRLLMFVEKQSKKTLLLRVATNRQTMDRIRSLHSDIDRLFDNIVLAECGGGGISCLENPWWKDQFDEDVAEQQEEVNELVKNPRKLTEELSDRELMEGLTMLKFEVDYWKDKHSEEEHELIKRRFYDIVRTSRARVPKIPEWFISSDDVDFMAKYYDIGWFNEVYIGKWTNAEGQVVDCMVIDSDFEQEEFVKKADAWFKLDHPNILKLLGASHVSTPRFYVGEKDSIKGNFVDYLAKNPEKLWKLFYEAAKGLRYLHENNIIHGRLKCNNLLVSGEDSAKISRLNFLYLAGEDPRQAHDSGYRWTAPERIIDEKLAATMESDIYSLGMCLYEAITGEPPWGMDDDETLAAKVTKGELPERQRKISDAAWDMITKMCAKEPKDRMKLEDIEAAFKEHLGAETI